MAALAQTPSTCRGAGEKANRQIKDRNLSSVNRLRSAALLAQRERTRDGLGQMKGDECRRAVYRRSVKRSKQQQVSLVIRAGSEGSDSRAIEVITAEPDGVHVMHSVPTSRRVLK